MVPSTSLDQNRPLMSSMALGEMKAVKTLRKKDKTRNFSLEEKKQETEFDIFSLLLDINARPDFIPHPHPHCEETCWEK